MLMLKLYFHIIMLHVLVKAAAANTDKHLVKVLSNMTLNSANVNCSV